MGVFELLRPLSTTRHLTPIFLDPPARLRHINRMTFRELITRLAHRLGRQHIPVRENAHDIHHFLGQDSVHHDLVKLAVRKIYKANRCGHLDAKVEWKPSIKAAIALRNTLIQSESADVEQVQLFDELIDGISALLPWDEAETSADAAASEKQAVQILRYPFRRKKRA